LRFLLDVLEDDADDVELEEEGENVSRELSLLSSK
jgi:hypothetical protein